VDAGIRPLADAVSHSTSNMTDEDLAAKAACLKDSGAGLLRYLIYDIGSAHRQELGLRELA
jgi:hypothetical protein